MSLPIIYKLGSTQDHPSEDNDQTNTNVCKWYLYGIIET